MSETRFIRCVLTEEELIRRMERFEWDSGKSEEEIVSEALEEYLNKRSVLVA